MMRGSSHASTVCFICLRFISFSVVYEYSRQPCYTPQFILSTPSIDLQQAAGLGVARWPDYVYPGLLDFHKTIVSPLSVFPKSPTIITSTMFGWLCEQCHVIHWLCSSQEPFLAAPVYTSHVSATTADQVSFELGVDVNCVVQSPLCCRVACARTSRRCCTVASDDNTSYAQTNYTQPPPIVPDCVRYCVGLEGSKWSSLSYLTFLGCVRPGVEARLGPTRSMAASAQWYHLPAPAVS